MSFDITAALTEVQAKTDTQIEIETAYKWGSRALACYLLHERSGELRWFLRAEDMRHEAIEHAALSGEARVLQTIESAIETTRRRVAPR